MSEYQYRIANDPRIVAQAMDSIGTEGNEAGVAFIDVGDHHAAIAVFDMGGYVAAREHAKRIAVAMNAARTKEPTP